MDQVFVDVHEIDYLCWRENPGILSVFAAFLMPPLSVSDHEAQSGMSQISQAPNGS